MSNAFLGLVSTAKSDRLAVILGMSCAKNFETLYVLGEKGYYDSNGFDYGLRA